ncbi:MAG: GntR family transcriptional regulator, partial [Actinobacteria bacterium]|nr:GntR family transcriptional regulator [Actinomycetota bacterium]
MNACNSGSSSNIGVHPLFSKFAITLAAFAPSAQAAAVRCGNDEDDDLIPSAPRGRTRADGIASEIERAILARQLAVGELIGSEETLAERFGASRPVVREAFRILELSGLATTRRGPGGGLIVVAPNPDPVVA